MSQASLIYPWFVRKDLDGFFGLMIDNLIQLILIVSLCRELVLVRYMGDTFASRRTTVLVICKANDLVNI
ncbi:MAG: hypothetical protein ACREQA_09325 [Candidatus Binatia bacterium]